MKKTATFKREKKTMEYTIEWYKDDESGWFEIYDEESGGEDYYAEGGLEFDGNKLTDYDGVFSLDDEVLKCLKEWGADVVEMEELKKIKKVITSLYA